MTQIVFLKQFVWKPVAKVLNEVKKPITITFFRYSWFQWHPFFSHLELWGAKTAKITYDVRKWRQTHTQIFVKLSENLFLTNIYLITKFKGIWTVFRQTAAIFVFWDMILYYRFFYRFSTFGWQNWRNFFSGHRKVPIFSAKLRN